MDVANGDCKIQNKLIEESSVKGIFSKDGRGESHIDTQ
jgi:hypothetical protein